MKHEQVTASMISGNTPPLPFHPVYPAHPCELPPAFSCEKDFSPLRPSASSAVISSRFVLLLYLVLTLNSCAAGSFLWYRIAPDYPRDRSETLSLPGLDAPVKVYIDETGVPHISASTEKDLLRAVGFWHARERFFQMDGMRRLARGRLSELVGEQNLLGGTTVSFDRTMRGWGFEEGAEQDAARLDGEMFDLMTAYVAGVNAALKMYTPLEYRLLRVDPEPWTLSDSFALGRLNAWSVTHNWHQETSRLLLALYLGVDRANEIYGSEPWPGGTTLESKSPRQPLPPAVVEEVRSLFPPRPYDPGLFDPQQATLTPFLPASASNAWVVDGRHSASGKPIVANDPHLVHLLPSILFQQHIQGGDLNAIGATLPGIPFVIFGHNHRTAWGSTAAVSDTTDLFIEQFEPRNSSQVLGPSGSYPIHTRDLTIRIRHGSSFREEKSQLRSTRNGPLLNDIYPELLPPWAPPVSIRWDTSGSHEGLQALRQANLSANVGELRAALLQMQLPSQTCTAADVDGNIAVFTVGRVPLRQNHRGTFPAAGWSSRYDWDAFIGADDMPHGLNPDSGWFAHANNIMVHPASRSPFIQVDSAPSYRYDRIAELLDEIPLHSPDSFAKIQTDVALNRARSLLPELLTDLTDLSSHGETYATAVHLLQTWDSIATPDSSAAAIFFVTYREAVLVALRDEVPARALEFILSQRYSTNVMDEWLSRKDHPVWDDRATPEVETRTTTVQAAFRKAVALLGETQGPDPEKWKWGKIHHQAPRHLFGGKKALSGLLNLPPSPAGGGLDSVWKSHFDLGRPDQPYRAMAGPAFRMIVDLADMDHALWIVDTGSSGWPGSPHYGDQYPLWQTGRYAPMLFEWGEIQRKARAKIILQ